MPVPWACGSPQLDRSGPLRPPGFRESRVLGAGPGVGACLSVRGGDEPPVQAGGRGLCPGQGRDRVDRQAGEARADLGPEDQRRYRALENRCRAILRQQSAASTPVALSAQGDGLRRLSWIYLRLLLTRQSITRALRESTGPGMQSESFEDRIRHLEARLQDTGLSEGLRKSLSGQIEILKQRLDKQKEAGKSWPSWRRNWSGSRNRPSWSASRPC